MNADNTAGPPPPSGPVASDASQGGTWIPFVILFVLIGLALSALGINLFRHRG